MKIKNSDQGQIRTIVSLQDVGECERSFFTYELLVEPHVACHPCPPIIAKCVLIVIEVRLTIGLISVLLRNLES